MKKLIKNTLLLAVLPLACFCSKKETPETPGAKGELVTISASIADNKVTINPGTEAEDPALKLAWETTDQIVIEGTTSSTFTVSSLDGPHKAYFTGEAPQGSVFNVYYPNKDVLTRSYESQTQDGNASTDHLTYNAIAEGVTDYSSVNFTKVNGAVKLVVKVPSTVTAVSSIAITSQDSEGAAQEVFYKTNNAEGAKTSTITIGFSEGTAPAEGVLTAYAMVSWNVVELAANSRINVKLNVPGQTSTYQKTIKLSNATSVAGGQTFILDMSGATEMKYTLAGSGTSDDPYKIYTKEDMQAVKDHLAKKNSTTETTYFELMNDVDMENENFYALAPITFYKIDFSSNDKTNRYTLKNVNVASGEYASIFGVLNGSVHDVNFDHVVVNQKLGNPAGVVCGFLGAIAEGIVGEIKNVNITDSDVSYECATVHSIGGVCGYFGRGAIENVNVDSQCTVTHKATISTSYSSQLAIGGIAGRIRVTEAFSIKNCTCAATITWKTATLPSATDHLNEGMGGIIGMVSGDFSGFEVSGCTFNGKFVIDPSSINLYHIGGIVGIDTSNGMIISNCTNNATITLPNHIIGGIIGKSTKAAKISDCKNTANISGAGKNYIAGIVGVLGTGATVSKCSNTGAILGSGTVGGVVGTVFTSGTISECFSTGNVSAKVNAGGLAGSIKSATIKNCYTKTGVAKLNQSGATQIIGGIVGEIYLDGTKLSTISNCWSSMNLEAPRIAGGIVGRVCNNAWTVTTRKSLELSNCIYCGSISVPNATSGNGSSGAIVAYTSLTNVLSNSWRVDPFTFTTGNTYNVAIDHENFDGKWAVSANDATAKTRQVGTGKSKTNTQYLFPYWGKAAASGATVSSTVTDKSLGWDTNIWDLTTAFPTLKNNPES